MAAGAGVTLDTIVIEIESNAEKANTNLAGLTKTLSELKSAVKGGFNSLKVLAESLEKLNQISSSMPTTVKNLSSISKITKSLSELSKIDKPTGLAHAIKNIAEIPGVFNSIDTSTIENVHRVSKELADALTPLANKMAQIGEGFSKMQMLADRYGVSVTKVRDKTKTADKEAGKFKVTMRDLSKMFTQANNKANDFGKASMRVFRKLNSKIKQVYLSLLGTRTLFTLIRKAVSEYMQMDDELTKTTQNLWRALGAQLAPAIEYVLHIFKQAVRVIYSMVLALTGVDLIARANAKAMRSMSKSAKDALGNLQKFDDLNVVEFPSGGESSNLIELEPIDLSPIQRVIDILKKLKIAIKDAWQTGEWEGVFAVLSEATNALVDKFLEIDGVKLGKNISNAVVSILTGIWKFFRDLPTEEIGEKLHDILSNIDWGEILTKLLSIFITAFGSLSEIILGALFGAKFTDKGIAAIWGLIALFGSKLLLLIPSLLITLLTGAGGLGSGAGSMMKSIGQGVQMIAMLGGLALVIREISGLLDTFSQTGLTVNETIGLMATVFLGLSVAVMAMAAAFNLMDWKGIAAGVVILGGLALVIQTITNLLKTLSASGMDVWDVATLLGVVLLTIVGLMGAVALIGPAMTAGLLPFSILMLEIAGILTVMALTLPTILDACGKFIETIAPPIESILKTIGKLITDIIYSLGTVLPPIINSVGSLFTKIFNGISSVVMSVGNSIVNILNAAGNLVEKVLNSILKFIRELGPAINKFVDNAIQAVTKLINFLISGIEYLVNRLVIDGINGIIKGINKIGKYVGFTIPVVAQFKIPRFIPKLETGTNEIPYEGLYHLHPGEAVVPKKYNPAIGGGNSEETNQKLDTLISIMNSMEFTNVVNIGNKTIYKGQQKYNSFQNDKYGTTVNT